jgi:alkylated DNA nucleotide flippase Atl1
MNRFARFLDALYESRRREAERVIRRHGHIAAQAATYQRQRIADEAEAETAAVARAASRLATRSAS